MSRVACSCLLLALACTRQSAAPIVAATGGSVALGSEVSLAIPAGSLPEDTTIGIERLGALPEGDKSAFRGVGQVYRMTPAGTQFDLQHPALLTLKLDVAGLRDQGLDPATVVLHYLDERDHRFYAVPTQLDLEKQQLTARLEHFTVYAPLALATVAGDAPPFVSMAGSIPPAPRTGSPLLIRAIARDVQPGGSIASVRVSFQSNGDTITYPMSPDPTPNVTDLWQVVLPPEAVLSGASFTVVAEDALGATASPAPFAITPVSSRVSGSQLCSPSPQTMTAGSRRLFTFTAKDLTGATYPFLPLAAGVSNDTAPIGAVESITAAGALFQARRAGTDALIGSLGGVSNVRCQITVLDGPLDKLVITDPQGNAIVGPINAREGARIQLDARGEDAFGNQILVRPTWSQSDPAAGFISSSGLYYALDAVGTQVLTARAGSVKAQQYVNIPPASWVTSDEIGSGSFFFGEVVLAGAGAAYVLGDGSGFGVSLHARTQASDPASDVEVATGMLGDLSMAGGPSPMLLWTDFSQTPYRLRIAQLVGGYPVPLPGPHIVNARSETWHARIASGGGKTYLAWDEIDVAGNGAVTYLAHWDGAAWAQDGGNVFPGVYGWNGALAVRSDGTPYLVVIADSHAMRTAHWDGSQLISDPSLIPATGEDFGFSTPRAAFRADGTLFVANLAVASQLERVRISALDTRAPASAWADTGETSISSSYPNFFGVPHLAIDGETPWVSAATRNGFFVSHLGLDRQWHRRPLNDFHGFIAGFGDLAPSAEGMTAVIGVPEEESGVIKTLRMVTLR